MSSVLIQFLELRNTAITFGNLVKQRATKLILGDAGTNVRIKAKAALTLVNNRSVLGELSDPRPV